ncbi:hypothetical protein L3Q82_001866 [Scortum barcoo]|uniref:Uncharacterized protein n=1 Tax=Scortum barcoo TaxID=214431 RepID=A0ACB8W504_9TELE|nr:hypothetical protein L3Q82_001866 [Scortum barcoo]
MRGGIGSSRPPPRLLPKPHCTGPSWTFLRVVRAYWKEGGPTSPFRAEPGRVPVGKDLGHQAPPARSPNPRPGSRVVGPGNANPGDAVPKPIAMEPCWGSRAGVLTVLMYLPRVPSGILSAGTVWAAALRDGVRRHDVGKEVRVELLLPHAERSQLKRVSVISL